MIATVSARFPGARMKAVLGGFHLIGLPFLNTMAGSKEEVRAIARENMTFTVDRLYTAHCTGTKAYADLKEVLGEKLIYTATDEQLVL